MEKEYLIGGNTDYSQSVFVGAFLGIYLILSIVFLGIFIGKYEIVNVTESEFGYILVINFIFTIAIGFYIYSRSSFKGLVVVSDQYLIIPNFRTIYYSEITKIDTTILGGNMYLVTHLKEGKQICFSITSNFSKSAEIAYFEFIKDIKNRFEIYTVINSK